MLERRSYSESDVTFFFCSPLISWCWKIDLANIEGVLISNENIFFHFNLIHRRWNIQTSAPGKNTRCLQSGQARWLGPDCNMLGLCRYLQMNCTANSSISHSLFGLNKRRVVIFFHPSEREKSCLVHSFKNILLCSNLTQRQPHFLPAARHCGLMHCEQAFAYHMSNAGGARIGFCHCWQKSLRKDSESGCASQGAAPPPKHPSTCTGHGRASGLG